MDKLIKVVAAVALFMIVLAFPASAMAEGGIQSGLVVSTAQSDKDMMATLSNVKDTSMAASIMKDAGLAGITSPGGKYTLFVASDTALKATSPDVRNRMMERLNDRQFATYFVKGHLVDGMVMPDQMTNGKTLSLMNGKAMQVHTANGRMMIDDAAITKAIQTSNGMIYVMDKIPSSIMAMIK